MELYEVGNFRRYTDESPKNSMTQTKNNLVRNLFVMQATQEDARNQQIDVGDTRCQGRTARFSRAAGPPVCTRRVASGHYRQLAGRRLPIPRGRPDLNPPPLSSSLLRRPFFLSFFLSFSSSVRPICLNPSAGVIGGKGQRMRVAQPL